MRVRRPRPSWQSSRRSRDARPITGPAQWQDPPHLIFDRIAGTDAIAAREALTERFVRMTLALAHLAPSIVTAIVGARL